MHIAIISALLLSPFHLVHAEEIATFGKNMAGFADYAHPGRSLLISEDGEAEWREGSKVTARKKYKITDETCVPRTQSTMVMGDGVSGRGFTLAYPFLVGAERACVFNDEKNAISLIENYRERLPRNYFSAVYVGADDRAVHFLINGRPFPDAEWGYLELLSIDRSSFGISLRRLVDEVPDLSGGMYNDGHSIWVTTWDQTNDIYRMPVNKLLELIHAEQPAGFSGLFEKAYADIDGFSFFLIGNGNSLLFHNEGYESFSVDLATGVRKAVTPCSPVAGLESGWLVLCEGRILRTWTGD